jgi:hypothetical protein
LGDFFLLFDPNDRLYVSENNYAREWASNFWNNLTLVWNYAPPKLDSPLPIRDLNAEVLVETQVFMFLVIT